MSDVRCAIYARFSSDQQKDTSVDDQLRDCRRFAERKGWTVVAEYSDARISGTRIRRPGVMQLVEALKEGAFDTILVEHQDRLTRDLEDIAWLYKQVLFADARIYTIARGELRPMDVGVQGAMDAEDLKKLADRVRRGQRGAVERGRVPGGKAYGYAIVRELDAKGELIRGLRKVIPEEAAVVRRIYLDLAAGRSAKMIARDLNADGVKGPRGTDWTSMTILGSKAKKTGIAHNPIYAGRIAYGRVNYRRHPDTRNRVYRITPDEEIQYVQDEALRIVGDELWQAVQDELTARAFRPLGLRVRPKYLLSGLLVCAGCGGGIATISVNRLGCTKALRGGGCPNHNTIARSILQGRVLSGLETQLLSDDAIALLMREYHQHRAQRLKEIASVRPEKERRVRELDGSIARLVDAISAGGAAFSEIRSKLEEQSAERDRLRAELDEAETPAVIDLHPKIGEVYRDRVRAIIAGLETGELTEDSSAGQIRALIDHIVMTPRGPRKGYDIDVVCSLQAAVALALGKAERRSRSGVTVVSDATCLIRSYSTRQVWKTPHSREL